MRALLVGAIASLALAAFPASALDLTGTWVGKLSCTEYDGQLAKVTVSDDEKRITQLGDAFAVDSTSAYSGLAIADGRSPDKKGEAKLASCTTDNVPGNGGDELVRLKAKVDRTKGKGKLKGTSIFTRPGVVGTCKWSYKLVDPADPLAAGCAM